MTLSQLLYNIPVKFRKMDEEISGISCDSRKTEKNMLFVALEPNSEKRALHIHEALSRGAKIILCPFQKEDFPQAIFSSNPRLHYGLISTNWFQHPSKQLTLIAVTGTNGKTTTTHIIKAMLEGLSDKQTRKIGLIGTNENKIGERSIEAHRTTPDAYELQSLLRQMADNDCTHVVMEVSSHGLSQYRTAGLQFDVAIFTNLTQDHLDYHHTMQEYKKAKQKLFDQSKISIINIDDEAGREYVAYLEESKKSFFTYSENKTSADFHCENIHLFPHYVSFDCIHKNRKIPIYLPIPGGFSIYNALASLVCGQVLDLPLQRLAETFPKIKGVKGRIEVLPTPSDFTVVIDYAHTPNALENILLTTKNITENRLICLFGCGGNRDRSKRRIMGEIAEDLADIVVVTSDNPRYEKPEEIISEILQGMNKTKEIKVIPNRKEAVFWALNKGESGDLILLAGKGHECYQEISGIKHHLDEREIVAEFFSRRDEKKTSIKEKNLL